MTLPLSELSVSLETEPQHTDVRTVAQGLERSIQVQLGASKVSRFSIFVRSAPGDVVGGLNARVAFGNLHVDQVWCDESIRVRGYGSELLERAERFAFEQGATAAVLNTVDPDLVTFYGRRGYRLIGEVDGLLGARSVFFMRKELAAHDEPGIHAAAISREQPPDELREETG
jgi:GNAT superfamily N-acetyltransferase